MRFHDFVRTSSIDDDDMTQTQTQYKTNSGSNNSIASPITLGKGRNIFRGISRLTSIFRRIAPLVKKILRRSKEKLSQYTNHWTPRPSNLESCEFLMLLYLQLWFLQNGKAIFFLMLYHSFYSDTLNKLCQFSYFFISNICK